MTPAINRAKKAKIQFKVHEYEHDKNTDSYGKEAAIKLNISQDRIFKTLVVSLDNKQLAVSVLPVSKKLNLKSFASALGAKKAAMANHNDAERATGYILGGISPLGQKKQLKILIHKSAESFETVFVSAGKRGLDIELSPKDLRTLTSGTFADIIL
jgi:Cys-tRNA(Pro)/Cys-tRNA(Cys) deacylase